MVGEQIWAQDYSQTEIYIGINRYTQVYASAHGSTQVCEGIDIPGYICVNETWNGSMALNMELESILEL